MDRWTGKTAVVTGASSGIGSAVCVALANSGMQVLGLARRVNRIDELKSKVHGAGAIHSMKCDVSKPEEVEAAFKFANENLGGVHVLMNAAGVIVPGNITDIESSSMQEADLIATINLNLTGLILCTRRAISSMKRLNFDGHIINVSSIAGHYIPFRVGFNVYPGTKYGVTAFSKTLINELAQLNSKIKVTNLSPGLVRTEMAKEAVMFVDFQPLEPQDVADTVLFLLSTPPNVNITELTIQPVAEKRL